MNNNCFLNVYERIPRNGFFKIKSHHYIIICKIIFNYFRNLRKSASDSRNYIFAIKYKTTKFVQQKPEKYETKSLRISYHLPGID